jgi:hypothetical protein
VSSSAEHIRPRGRAFAERLSWVFLFVLLTGCSGDYEGALEGVRFSVQLPAGAQVVREEHLHEMSYRRWEVPGGFVVVIEHIRLSTPEPCRSADPRPGRSGPMIDGVFQPAAFSVSYCIDDTSYLDCSCWHTRHRLEPDELEPARAVCDSFRLLR